MSKPRKVQLDQLPYLAVKRIFEFLNLRDLARCRAVCRQFKFYADEARVNELVVCNCGCMLGQWHLTNRSIDFRGSISWKEFSSLKPSKFKLNQQLKFLHIHLGRWFNLNPLGSLSAFKQLVHLELDLSQNHYRIRKLTLPELRVLKLSGSYLWSCVLNTPKLEVLSCCSISQLQFDHPDTIKCLECDYPGSELMEKFLGVETFKCHSIVDLNPNLLSAWKSLKELDIQDSDLKYSLYLDEIKSSLADILKQRKISKREELKIYLGRVQLMDEPQLEDYSRMELSNFKLKYFTKLLRGSGGDVFRINYVDLMSWHPELSTDFFDKFPLIQTLEANGTVDREQFEWFLKNLSWLSDLKLANTSLDQAFMDNLPNIINRLLLTKLTINESFLIDFSFILHFEYLLEFKTNQQFEGSFDLAAKMFQRPFFYRFQFRKADELVQIKKPSKANYDLEVHRLEGGPKRNLTYFEQNLKWPKLIGLWKQRKEHRTGRVTRHETKRSWKRFKAGP